MITLALLGLIVFVGATVVGIALPRPVSPPVIYVRTEVPPHNGEGDAGFGLLIFLILAIVVALAAQ